MGDVKGVNDYAKGIYRGHLREARENAREYLDSCLASIGEPSPRVGKAFLMLSRVWRQVWNIFDHHLQVEKEKDQLEHQLGQATMVVEVLGEQFQTDHVRLLFSAPGWLLKQSGYTKDGLSMMEFHGQDEEIEIIEEGYRYIDVAFQSKDGGFKPIQTAEGNSTIAPVEGCHAMCCRPPWEERQTMLNFDHPQLLWDEQTRTCIGIDHGNGPDYTSITVWDSEGNLIKEERRCSQSQDETEKE